MQLRDLANAKIWTSPKPPPRRYEDQLKLNDKYKVDIDYRKCEKRNKMRTEMATSYGQSSSVEDQKQDRVTKKAGGARPDFRQKMKEA